MAFSGKADGELLHAVGINYTCKGVGGGVRDLGLV